MRFFMVLLLSIFLASNLNAAVDEDHEEHDINAPENVKDIFDKKDYEEYERLISTYAKDLADFYEKNASEYDANTVFIMHDSIIEAGSSPIEFPDGSMRDIPDNLKRDLPRTFTSFGKLVSFSSFFFGDIKQDPDGGVRNRIINFRCANKPRGSFHIYMFGAGARVPKSFDETININVGNHPTITVKGRIIYAPDEVKIVIDNTPQSERALSYFFLSELDLADDDDPIFIHAVQTNASVRLNVNTVRYSLRMLDKYCPQKEDKSLINWMK